MIARSLEAEGTEKDWEGRASEAFFEAKGRQTGLEGGWG